MQLKLLFIHFQASSFVVLVVVWCHSPSQNKGDVPSGNLWMDSPLLSWDSLSIFHHPLVLLHPETSQFYSGK